MVLQDAALVLRQKHATIDHVVCAEQFMDGGTEKDNFNWSTLVFARFLDTFKLIELYFYIKLKLISFIFDLINYKLFLNLSETINKYYRTIQ